MNPISLTYREFLVLLLGFFQSCFKQASSLPRFKTYGNGPAWPYTGQGLNKKLKSFFSDATQKYIVFLFHVHFKKHDFGMLVTQNCRTNYFGHYNCPNELTNNYDRSYLIILVNVKMQLETVAICYLV